MCSVAVENKKTSAPAGDVSLGLNHGKKSAQSSLATQIAAFLILPNQHRCRYPQWLGRFYRGVVCWAGVLGARTEARQILLVNAERC